MGPHTGADNQIKSLEVRLVERISALNLTIATAESCSGGLIAHRITNIPGVSAFYLGGIVCYSNEAKVSLLDVRPESLEAYGAVSEAVAGQMAEGVRARFGADLGVGVTGIAGPGGGTAEKPVGLVYLAVSGHAGTVVRRQVFEGDRGQIKAQTADKAFEMLLEYIR